VFGVIGVLPGGRKRDEAAPDNGDDKAGQLGLF
jgi:hypothetical protein